MTELFACGRSALDSRFTLKGAEPRYSPDRAFDTEHIRLDLRLDLKRKALQGTCRTRLRALADGAAEASFDAVQMRVTGVRAAGRALDFAHKDGKLKVQLPRPARRGARLELEIAYRVVRPRLGLHFVGPDRAYPDKPVQAWTQGEDEYARHWFPCHDAPHDRTTTELLVRVPRGFTAVSNGRLVRKAARGRETLFHWKQDVPHATYLVTLAVGEFVELRDRWRKVPVLYYVPRGREADARRAFGKTPKMMEFFSRRVGVPYPYPKYAQVAAVDFIYGGMENTSATTQTALTLHDERAHLDFSSDYLVAHELAHQWFGDLLTCRDWSHAWLNESFATYFEALFTEFDRGGDEFAHEMERNAEVYFEEDRDHYRRAIVTKVYKRPSDLFDRHLYEKGSRVLHMLRYLLGEAGFWASVRRYTRDNRGRAVVTSDLIDAVEKATGRNLAQFFDQWVYGAGHPEYKVRYWWDAARREAVLRVTQSQSMSNETGLFSLPVEFAFHDPRGGRKLVRENVEKKSHLFRFKLDREPSFVLFDPGHWILKKLDFPKPQAQWAHQLKGDPHPLGRVEAATKLGQAGGPSAVRVLAEALEGEAVWYVQGEIAQALAKIGSPAAVEALLSAHRSVKHPKARRMINAALGEVRHPLVRDRLSETWESESSYFAQVEALKSLARQGDPEARGVLDRALARDSWNDVTRSGALEALTQLKPDDLLPTLVRHAAYGRPHTRRLTAVRCLAQAGTGREDVQRRLLRLARDPFLLVQLAAVKGLGRIGDERVLPALRKLAAEVWDGRLIRTAEEVIEKLKKGLDEPAGPGGK